ncbi:hypothetical protein ACQR1Y_11045 [Bradyrhizobium sp. HKCCYLRH3099]|uniref:hypothetical protein n=1 Tax=unclassified Bradyrhizobium TaxID=2631580 RepID=UPI003EBF83E0
MALHRDIFWIGRQWAVTAAGIQAIDQRLKGAFDIDRGTVWNEGLPDALRAQSWFNPADFEKALSIARTRFARPPRGEPASSAPACPPPPAASGAPSEPLQVSSNGRLARFVPQWRIRS